MTQNKERKQANNNPIESKQASKQARKKEKRKKEWCLKLKKERK